VVKITVAYYLGIDGGGSKTTCAIGDEFTTLASATSGPSNITRVGEAPARESIQNAIREACAAIEVPPQTIKRTCIGAAGAAREGVAAAVRRFTAEITSGEIEVVGDMAIAMEAAFGTGPGVIVIAGTGSIAYGREARGATARAGGWGFAISDEGSAHWIGRQAIAMLLRAADETSAIQTSLLATPLFRELQAVWTVNSLDQLARAANANTDFAALFPAVLAASDGGDDVALGVLEKAAAELAQLAAIVIRSLFSKEKSLAAPEIPMAMAGGVFRHAQEVRERFSQHIRRGYPRVVLHGEIVEPVFGALQLARRSK
jgi:glucosamine kinase